MMILGNGYRTELALNGVLFYDADGSGTRAAVKFAVLNTGLKLTAADFDIVF